MKPADVCIAVPAVIQGLAFVASRIALTEFSPEPAKRSHTSSRTVLPKIA